MPRKKQPTPKGQPQELPDGVRLAVERPEVADLLRLLSNPSGAVRRGIVCDVARLVADWTGRINAMEGRNPPPVQAEALTPEEKELLRHYRGAGGEQGRLLGYAAGCSSVSPAAAGGAKPGSPGLRLVK